MMQTSAQGLVHNICRRPHVLLLIPTLGGGGAERFVATMAKHLNRERFRITLAVIDSRDAVFREEIPSDVEFIDLAAPRLRYALPRIVALSRRLQPDVVFSTLGHLNLALAMVRPWLPRLSRTIARETIVVSYGLERYRLRAVWALLYRLFYRRHDHIVCQSRDMHDDLVQHFHLPRRKALVIHNPVDLERIRRLSSQPAALPSIPTEAVRLIAAGRLDHQKGFDILIEAIWRLQDGSVHLTLLGSGPQEEELRRQIACRGLADRIHVVGFQRNPYAWFAKADAFVLSSRYEGFPNVVLEALACGTPVVATPAPGGTLEILKGIDGCVLADSIDAEALARAIRSWLDRPRSRIAEAVLEPYRIERIIGAYESLFDGRQI